MEHDTIVFIENYHTAILGSIGFAIAWFKNELKTVVPVVWKFLGDYHGYRGVWLYISTGQTEPKKKEIQNETPLH